MKAITHLALFTIATAAMVGSSFAEPLKGWSEDLDKALEQAKKEKKSVLVEFTGSDWCPPCKMMRKDVFSKSEFVDAASKNFILVEIDMPRGDKEVAEKNQPTVKKYKVDGFPTVILLDSDGKEFGRFYASEHPKTEDFLKRLDKELEKKDLD
ncbi:MAG: thioredoxin family protein [Akkermansiaceae bacterium]|nr:thioredoxin family protein [Akkermansiaceae bacterium]